MNIYLITLFGLFLLYVVYKIVQFNKQRQWSNDQQSNSVYTSSYEIAISAMRKNELLKVIESEPQSSSRRKKAEERFNKYFKKIR